MSESKYHIAMFPWFAMGHITPFLHLSNQLAQRGHKISFLLPPKLLLQLQNENLHPNLITFHPITVPHVEGLPIGTQTASDIPIHLTGLLATAMDITRNQFQSFLYDHKPNFVFYDIAHWVPDIASMMNIKTICYQVVSAASLAIALVPSRKVPKDRPMTITELASPPPGYPSTTVVLHVHEAKALSFITFPFGKDITFYEKSTYAMKKCDAIAIRTCQEIEGDMCDYISSQFEKPVFLTGSVLPEQREMQLEHKWRNWLDRFDHGSVILCVFGSQLVLEKEQFQELVLGFELTGKPFLVSLKPPFGVSTIEEALPEGFKERVKGRGVVLGDWVPQVLILRHPSIGCFVNHCGFGSMWECLMCDSQIVLVPHLGDQILNTRLLAEKLKVAVEVEKDENGWFSRDGLCKSINSVMNIESEVGGLVKRNHAKWKESLGKPGFMSDYVDSFIQKLHDLI